MKGRLRTLVSILLFSSICMLASAKEPQDVQARKEQKIKVSGGPYIAFLSSGFIHPHIEGGGSRTGHGVGLGGFLDMGIKTWFSIQFEMMSGYGQSYFTRPEEKGRFIYWGLEIPLYAMFHIHLKDRSMFNIGIGPFTDFGLSGIYRVNGFGHDVYIRDKATGLSTMKDNYSGIAVKAGYEFRFGLQLNCCCRTSLNNVLDENSSRMSMFPYAASLEIAYRF